MSRRRISNIRQVDRLGRICIPKDIRTMLGVTEETLFTVTYDVEEKEIRVIPLSDEVCAQLNIK
jgi:AbrB family looped-hinge helix DNA binding protein